MNRYLSDAGQVAQWLRSNAVEQDGGLHWTVSPRQAAPDRLDTNLYYGSAGVILFLLEHALVVEADLELARRAATQIVMRAEPAAGGLAWRLGWGDCPLDVSLYMGGAGVGFALSEVARASGAAGLATAAERALSAAACTHPEQLAGRMGWNGAADVVGGAAGIGLALLRDFEDHGAPDRLQSAIAAGECLTRLAARDGRAFWWNSGAQVFPNFSHGTAGIAAFLVELFRLTKREVFLEHALGAAEWLLDRRDASGYAWPHHYPDGRDLFYVGWCHGPSGTARLFYWLYIATGDTRWLDGVQRCAEWILKLRLAERPCAGLWNLGMCCGLAGVGDFFARLCMLFDSADYRTMATWCADELVAVAKRDEHGVRWPQAEHRKWPDAKLAQTGYSQGAAGIGLFLLRIAVLHGADLRLRVRLPDDPFPLPSSQAPSLAAHGE